VDFTRFPPVNGKVVGGRFDGSDTNAYPGTSVPGRVSHRSCGVVGQRNPAGDAFYKRVAGLKVEHIRVRSR
jgi:hypothetical protein